MKNIRNDMEEIFANDNVKIEKKGDLFKIEFKRSSYALINSLIKTHIILGGSTDEEYKTIIFKGEKVRTLKEYKHELKKINGKNTFLVSQVAKMIHNLTRQIIYLLEKESQTILGYNEEEIIVINDKKFAFLGRELVANINVDTELATISCPFSVKDFFVSPELLKIKEIPSEIHYKTCYFSLGLLILYVLQEDDEFYTEYLSHKEIDKLLDNLNNHPIKQTRIYWLLSRCLVEDPRNRSIILI